MTTFDLKMPSRAALTALTATALFFLAYWPVLSLLVEQWVGSEEYSHAFLVLPLIIYIVWQKRNALPARPARGSALGLLFLALAVPLYLFALVAQVYTLIMMSMVVTIVGALLFLWGFDGLRAMAMPLVLFLLLIPLSEQVLIRVTFPLQLKVSQISEVFIQLFGVPILREGNIMTIPGKSFEVVEACSGMRSMMTLITLAVIVGYFTLKRFSLRLVLVLTGIPIAIFINIIRVVAMILMFHFFAFDLSEGSAHTLLGLVVFVIALLLFFFIQRILAHWETKSSGD